MTLPEGLRERIEQVFVLLQGFPPPSADVPTAQYNELNALLDGVMAEVGFARHQPSAGDGHPASYAGRVVLRARDLTPAQRAVAEVFSTGPLYSMEAYPLPAHGWAQRQWLGHDPGPLFREREDGSTLYEQLRALDVAEHDRLQATIDAMTPRERIEVSADHELLKGDHVLSLPWRSLEAMCEQIDGTYGAWGRDLAERLVLHDFRATRFAPFHFIMSPLPRLAFLAMARSGEPISPRFDEVFVLDIWASLAEQRDVLDAFPAERREAALLTGVTSALFPAQRVAIALRLLPHYPYPSIVRYLFAHLDEARQPKDVLARLEHLALTIPAVDTELATYRLAVRLARAAKRASPQTARTRTAATKATAAKTTAAKTTAAKATTAKKTSAKTDAKR